MPETLLALLAQRVRGGRGDPVTVAIMGALVAAIGVGGLGYLGWVVVSHRRAKARDPKSLARLEVPWEIGPASLDPASGRAWAFAVGLNVLLLALGALALVGGLHGR